MISTYVLTALMVITQCLTASAFVPTNLLNAQRTAVSQQSTTRERVVLNLDFGSFGKFFNLNPSEDDFGKEIGSNNKNIHDDEEDEDDEYIDGTNIFSIKVKSLKIGGCRLYLSLYLIGEANNPERGTWRMDQTGEGGIDLYHRDATGALMIRFEEDEIIVNRFGSSPSMTYLMNESQILNMMLDQLDEIAFDKSIDENDRLILLNKPGDAIDIVRESLSFN